MRAKTATEECNKGDYAILELVLETEQHLQNAPAEITSEQSSSFEDKKQEKDYVISEPEDNIKIKTPPEKKTTTTVLRPPMINNILRRLKPEKDHTIVQTQSEHTRDQNPKKEEKFLFSSNFA